jgi:hypothetical protein
MVRFYRELAGRTAVFADLYEIGSSICNVSDVRVPNLAEPNFIDHLFANKKLH